jgi:hypothetical protein
VDSRAEPVVEPVRGGWMAISASPRVAVIAATKEDALAKLEDELDAWERLKEAPSAEG